MKLKNISVWVLPVAMALAVAPSVTARQASKTVYATFLDASGKPITDLTQDEIHVAENGKERTIVSAKRASTPLSVMMLGDTTKAAGGGGFNAASASSAGEVIGDIRAALAAFSRDILAASPTSEIGIMEFGQASITVTDFTSNQAELDKGLTRLFPKPTADSVLLEAVTEASKELGKRQNTRRAIISVNVEPGTELSKEPPNNIMSQLGKAQSPLFSVSIQKGDNKNSIRGVALPKLAPETGGRHEIIVGRSALVDKLKDIANVLLSQYEITYTRPEGPAPQALQFGVGRAGVKILATHFPPQ